MATERQRASAARPWLTNLVVQKASVAARRQLSCKKSQFPVFDSERNEQLSDCFRRPLGYKLGIEKHARGPLKEEICVEHKGEEESYSQDSRFLQFSTKLVSFLSSFLVSLSISYLYDFSTMIG